MNHIERRFSQGKVELRAPVADATPETPSIVRGYAAVYGKESNPLFMMRNGKVEQFVEVIEAGFFDNVLQDDVRALFNHDANMILARSNAGAGTLKLSTDETGLAYEFEAPDTCCGEDLAVSLKRGDITSSSFAFEVKDGGDMIARRADGMLVRTLLKGGCSRLHDVSPVTYPAYEDATATVRSLDKFLAAKPADEKSTQPADDHWAMRLRLLGLAQS